MPPRKVGAGLSGVSLAVIAGGFLLAFAGLRNAGVVDTARALIRGQLPKSRESSVEGERVAVAKWMGDVLKNAGSAMAKAAESVIGGITGYQSSTYNLGPVKAHVALVADTIGKKYGLKTIGGVRGDPFPDHPSGLALDFMINNIPEGFQTGQAISSELVARAREWKVKYVIWNRQVITIGDARGWHPYTSTPNPHTDHVHATFLP